MSDVWRYCPKCGTNRVGYFRFCFSCKFDYDELSYRPPAPPLRASSEAAPSLASAPISGADRATPSDAPISPRPTLLPPAAPTLTPPAAPVPAPIPPVAPPASPPAAAAAAATPSPARQAPDAQFPRTPPAPAAIEPRVPTPATPPTQFRPAGPATSTVAGRTTTERTPMAPAARVRPAATAAESASVPGAFTPAAPARRVPRSKVILRRAAPVLRYATVGLVGVLAVAVLMNIVSRAATQDARATGGAAGATAIATDHGAHATGGVAEPSPVASPSEVAQPSPTFAPIDDTRLAVVERVVDGESLIVDIDGEQYPLRYIGIDAPDPASTDPAARQLAAAATTTNASLVAGQEVYLEADVTESDEQGRLLRHVWYVDADSVWKLASEQLVRRGYARVATVGPDQKYAEALTAAQEAAVEGQLGLWEGVPAEGSGSPVAAPSSSAGTAECHPSYSPCLPVVTDLDCAEVRVMGLAPVEVKGPDEYRLDPDGDGTGCPIA